MRSCHLPAQNHSWPLNTFRIKPQVNTPTSSFVALFPTILSLLQYTCFLEVSPFCQLHSHFKVFALHGRMLFLLSTHGSCLHLNEGSAQVSPPLVMLPCLSPLSLLSSEHCHHLISSCLYTQCKLMDEFVLFTPLSLASATVPDTGWRFNKYL